MEVSGQGLDVHGALLAMALRPKSCYCGVGEKKVRMVGHHRAHVFGQHGVVRIRTVGDALDVGASASLEGEEAIIEAVRRSVV